MVLGSKGVGKTSVIEWLFNPQKFSSHNLEVYVPPPTHGIVRRWAEVDVQRNNFKNFHVCCYDFGGVSTLFLCEAICDSLFPESILKQLIFTLVRTMRQLSLSSQHVLFML